jgi:hypothetical protein
MAVSMEDFVLSKLARYYQVTYRVKSRECEVIACSFNTKNDKKGSAPPGTNAMKLSFLLSDLF